MPSTQSLAREAIAFAVEYADNCHIPEGFAEANGYRDEDWLSDWGAFLADQVWHELKTRGFRIVRDND